VEPSGAVQGTLNVIEPKFSTLSRSYLRRSRPFPLLYTITMANNPHFSALGTSLSTSPFGKP
jgi:hypothetical protein